MIILASIKIEPVFYLLAAAGFLGIAYSFWNSFKMSKLKSENQRISETATVIKNAVNTFLRVEYKFLILFVVSLGLLLFFYGKSQENVNELIAASMLLGAISSALAGFFSMRIANIAHEKVTLRSQESYSESFRTSFSSASSIGIIGASSIIIGLVILFLTLALTQNNFTLENINIKQSLSSLICGFALGASSIALFARLGGGIFAKSSDVAEYEIVATEPGIKEKSIHNAASVANEAGRTLLHVGGISADIFESASLAIIASMLLGAGLLNSELSNPGLIALPLVLVSIGIFSSIAGNFLLRSSEVSNSRKAINIAEIFSAAILSIAAYFSVIYLIPAEWDVTAKTDEELIITTYKGLGVFWSAFFGIASSVIISYITRFYTGKNGKTIEKIIANSSKGSSGNALGGMENGLISTGLPIALLLAVSLGAYYFSGFYGIGIAAVGYFGNLGLQVSFNAFAPIAENSNSIAIKNELEDTSIDVSKNMKTIGIQSLAQGRIFISLGASLAIVAILGVFIQQSNILEINLTNPFIMASLLVGAVLPVLISSNALLSVTKISKKIVLEVKRQFKDIPDLDDAKYILDKYNGDLNYATEGEKEIVYAAHNDADYKQCVEISAYATIWATLIPGIIAIAIPALFAMFGGAEMLAGMLIGSLANGLILSIFQANMGSSLENTRYALEEGYDLNGETIGKESLAYQAAMEGEKLGNPLKDTATSAVTVLIKLMLIVSIIMLPLMANNSKKSKAFRTDHLKIDIKHSNNPVKKNNSQKTFKY